MEAGTLWLAGTEEDSIFSAFEELLANKEAYDRMSKATNSYGGGYASARICDILEYAIF